MVKVNTTIRLDEDLKSEAIILAKKLWTNMSSVISMYLKNDFLENKWIELSKSYSNVQDLINDLRKNGVQY